MITSLQGKRKVRIRPSKKVFDVREAIPVGAPRLVCPKCGYDPVPVMRAYKRRTIPSSVRGDWEWEPAAAAVAEVVRQHLWVCRGQHPSTFVHGHRDGMMRRNGHAD
jgi:hypothetical protein